MFRGLRFWTKKVEGSYYYLCCENKGADNFAVTAKLICVFVFAYAKRWFSHDADGRRGGLVVEHRTPEREVGGSILPQVTVLCH